MVEIRYVQSKDKEFWYSLDRHLPEKEFQDKVDHERGYVLLEDGKPVVLLRYNLFCDNTPFCTMLFMISSFSSCIYSFRTPSKSKLS